ncbi:MAG TPA: PEF-CTERM sorting domain-containing protein [Methanosarcina sp.]|nr:PEF-CTERM sorting domain-containing protein [Methanosarcina sp.]
MKTVSIIGVLVFLLLTVNCAGAATTFSINNTNIDMPTGASVKIDVTYDAAAGTITFVDRSTGITNPRIAWVAYNLNVDKDQIKGYKKTSSQGKEVENEVLTTWEKKNNFGAKGKFGDLSRVYAVKNPGKNQFTKVVVKLKIPPGFDGTIPGNPDYQVGVHFVCDQFSCFVAGPAPEKPPIPETLVPEFPSIALPIAVILGLTFIMSNRRKK